MWITSYAFDKQVKPGFTNYLPRGLAQKIESFQTKDLKIFKKTLKNIQKCILTIGENSNY